METGTIIDKQIEQLEHLSRYVETISRCQRVGTVVGVSGSAITAQGPPAQIGELCTVEPGGTHAQVVGFRGQQTVLLPFGSVQGIEPGCRVIASGEQLQIDVGPQMLGRVVDCFGQPLDDNGPIPAEARRPLQANSPNPLQRRHITEPLWLGVRAIDGLLTCCYGQRLGIFSGAGVGGIFSGAGVGKSVLLGMVARHTTADVNVIALVGERGREVLDFLQTHLREGLERSVVVVTTSDQPPLLRLCAGLAATAIAEYFRDRGNNVLLLMDSLTRLARAQREVGLAAGEMPTTGGYPPSLYAMLPSLLERAGATREGIITGLYAILVERDDLQDPVADAANAILDGRIVLSRHLAEVGHYPAIDLTTSVSRLMNQAVDSDHRQAATEFKALVTAYAEARDLINVGAYTKGSDPRVDRAMARWAEMNQFLQQRPDESAPATRTRQWLVELMSTGRARNFVSNTIGAGAKADSGTKGVAYE